METMVSISPFFSGRIPQFTTTAARLGQKVDRRQPVSLQPKTPFCSLCLPALLQFPFDDTIFLVDFPKHGKSIARYSS
jgi:hypothetical protein